MTKGPKEPHATTPSEGGAKDALSILGDAAAKLYRDAIPSGGVGEFFANNPQLLPKFETEREDRKADITSANKQHESGQAVSETPPPQTADNAVRAFILLFALGFVLRGVDVMDHDITDAIQKWIIAAIISIIDYFYIPIRKALGPRFASTADIVATDFRWWTAAILTVLLWSAVAPIFEKHGWPWTPVTQMSRIERPVMGTSIGNPLHDDNVKWKMPKAFGRQL